MDAFWVDLIQVSTQVTSTLVACIMAFFAWNVYLREPAQESEPSEPEDMYTDTGQKASITVFDTSKQTTTLKSTDEGLKCFLKNKKNGQEKLQWVISGNEAHFYYSRKKYRVFPGYKANTGTFSIGPRRNWLYSKRLFPESIYLEDEIRGLLESSAGISGA